MELWIVEVPNSLTELCDNRELKSKQPGSHVGYHQTGMPAMEVVEQIFEVFGGENFASPESRFTQLRATAVELEASGWETAFRG